MGRWNSDLPLVETDVIGRKFWNMFWYLPYQQERDAWRASRIEPIRAGYGIFR
jgi:hypothetical protein